MKKHQLMTIFALAIVYVVWGSTFYGVKVAVDGGLAPFFLIGSRFLLAGTALYAFTRWQGVRPARAIDWADSALLGFLLLVCGTGLVAWSVQWISSSLAALLVATSPVWITMMDRRQKLTARKWFGLMLGLIGVGSLVGASLTADGEMFFWGCLGCLASTLAWAVGSLRGRDLGKDVSPILRAGMQMIWAGLILLSVSLVSGEQGHLTEVSAGAWWSLFYLTLFGSVVAYSAYTWLVANTSAALVSTHAYVNPVVAVLLGSWLGGEVLSAQTGVAAVVAMVGVVILMLPESAGSLPSGSDGSTALERELPGLNGSSLRPALALVRSGEGPQPRFPGGRGRRLRRRAS